MAVPAKNTTRMYLLLNLFPRVLLPSGPASYGREVNQDSAQPGRVRTIVCVEEYKGKLRICKS